MRRSEGAPLVLSASHAPGDILMLTAAVRDLHKAHPGLFVTDVKTNVPELWLNNPYVQGVPRKRSTQFIELDFHNQLPPVKASYATGTTHYIHAFHKELEDKLGINIPVSSILPDLHVSASELKVPAKYKPPYVILDAGGKRDITCKIWEVERFTELCRRFPDVTFLQIGRAHHLHKHINLPNVINGIEQFSMRELICAFIHATAVLTPVSFPMHLAAGVSGRGWLTQSEGPYLPCVVIAGGRENSNWEAYPFHTYLHTCNTLFCNRESGCWKRRVVRLEDGDPGDQSLCRCPVKTASGQYIPKCMDMISVDEVENALRRYLR